MDRTQDQISRDLRDAESRVDALRREFAQARIREERRNSEEQIAAGVTNACTSAHRIDGGAPASWTKDGSCSYCGSMTVAEAIKRLRTPGTQYSGADWKYGWPHKFYIQAGGYPHKFYNKHLADATDQEFSDFAALSRELFGVIWERNEKGIAYRAPRGIQRDGTI